MAAPLAMQLVVRVERTDPPTPTAACLAVAVAVVALLDDPRANRANPDRAEQADGGENGEESWADAVDAWASGPIRKIVRRARGAAWRRVQDVPGLTVTVDGVEVRALVPGPLDAAPPEVTKLQIESPPLDDTDPADTPGTDHGLWIAVTPLVGLSWGKAAAQCGHAAQRATATAPDDVTTWWREQGRPIHLLRPTPALWADLARSAPVTIRDAGHTEVTPGTVTTLAWWTTPTTGPPTVGDGRPGPKGWRRRLGLGLRP